MVGNRLFEILRAANEKICGIFLRVSMLIHWLRVVSQISGFATIKDGVSGFFLQTDCHHFMRRAPAVVLR